MLDGETCDLCEVHKDDGENDERIKKKKHLLNTKQIELRALNSAFFFLNDY